ncbi:MAG: LysR family transcriptional regulator [Actinomycetota bacterium]
MALPPTTPELASLDLFLSVVKLGSFSAAAKAHRVAQPSVSARIQSLERQLGVRLFDRSPTGSVPTTNGSLVAGWAEKVLQSVDELNAGVAALTTETTTPLRVAASYTIAEYLLPPVLEKLLRNRSADAIRLDVANSSAVLAALHDGRADLGFIESPSPAPGMREQLVAEDRLVTVVGRDHPWTGRRRPVTVAMLASTSLVVREPGSGTREALEVALAELGHGPPTAALELGSTAAVRAAVVGGGPPAVLSRLTVAADIDAGSLFEIDIEGLRIERRLRAVWPKDEQPPVLARELLTHLGPDGH